jgi:hypothetical protein
MTPILGIIASSISGSKAVTNSYESIATSNPSGVSTITFSSIASTYSHLQVRVSMIGASGGSLIVANFNGDTGANYTWHELQGAGTAAAAYSGTGNSYARLYGRNVGTSSTAPTALITDVLDYANVNKYKTIRSLFGMDSNGSGEVGISSNLWLSTAAINSITVKTHDGTNYASGTKIALYGIKGA